MAKTMDHTLSWNEQMALQRNKITFNADKMIKEPFQESNKLEPAVSRFFDQMIEETAAELLSFIQKCESPVERLLGLALCKVEKTFCSVADTGQYNVDSQVEIMCGDAKYRVDFLLSVSYLEKIHRVVIECDGHEFHQKTKQQVDKDNVRDRNLLKSGYLVARFSGSEITKDPIHCAREANYMIFHSEVGPVG